MIKRTVSLALAAASIAVGAGSLTAQPAHAETSGPTHGRIVSSNGVVVRSYPSTTASRFATVRGGQSVDITCKIHGRSVDGNDLWYALSDYRDRWVAARYVANVGAAPQFCGTIVHQPERTLATVNERVAPSTADPKAGRIAKGVKVSVVCGTVGQQVGDSNYWAYLTDGRWVSAEYLGGYEGGLIDCA